MKNDISLASITALGKPIGRFFSRYGLISFFVVIFTGLIIAVILLNNVITKTGDAGDYVSTANTITFDEDTIKKVESLPSSNQNTDRVNTSGRLLPF